MNTNHTRKNRITAAIGAAIVGAAAAALLFLGAGTAHAMQDISEHGGIAAIDYLPCRGTAVVASDSTPSPIRPETPIPASRSGSAIPTSVRRPSIPTTQIWVRM